MGSRTCKIGPQTIAAMQSGDIVWDSELSRFGARRRNASTTYFVKARVDGRQRWINLGRHGPITPAEARAKARQVLGDVDSGRDPTREREMGRAAPLFEDFADKWLRDHVRSKRKPVTFAEYRRIVDLHLKPCLAKVRIDRLDQTDALKVHDRLASTPYQANRALAVLSALMTFAEGKHRPRLSNPCRGVERFREKKRKRPLTIKELATLWGHLAKLEATENPYIIGALRLLLLTGMRREEALTLRRDFVDLSAGVIHLPDTKTGPRTIILSTQAVQVISDLPALDDNPYVFPGLKKGQRLVNISDHWDVIRRALGFPEVRIHDLRHTVGSLMARTSSLIVVRDALGHQEISTTNGYSHAANDDVRTAVEALGGLIASQVG